MIRQDGDSLSTVAFPTAIPNAVLEPLSVLNFIIRFELDAYYKKNIVKSLVFCRTLAHRVQTHFLRQIVMSRWVTCRRAGWSARVASLLAGAALLCLRAPLSSRFDADFPHHKPDQLSEFLADFNNHPKLYAHIRGSWQVEVERNNYTWWQYVVSYECGARCAGHVELGAGVSGDALSHGRALGEHRMHVRDERCMHLPLLLWPQICVETETETIIKPRLGGGAHLTEWHVTRCSALAALTGSCGAYGADERERTLRAAIRTTIN